MNLVDTKCGEVCVEQWVYEVHAGVIIGLLIPFLQFILLIFIYLHKIASTWRKKEKNLIKPDELFIYLAKSKFF